VGDDPSSITAAKETTPQPTRCDPFTAQTTLPPGLSLIRQTLIGQGISTKAKDIIMASWHTGTTKQYDVYLRRWEQFYQSKGINRLDANRLDGNQSIRPLSLACVFTGDCSSVDWELGGTTREGGTKSTS